MPAISSRKLLASKFVRTIATIGITKIAPITSSKSRGMKDSIRLSCRNYIPIFGCRKRKQREPFSPSAWPAAPAPCASSATPPQPAPSRPAHKPAPPSLHDESASPSKSLELQPSTSQRLEYGSRVRLSCQISQATEDASHSRASPPIHNRPRLTPAFRQSLS
jgi:hypothetical protein